MRAQTLPHREAATPSRPGLLGKLRGVPRRIWVWLRPPRRVRPTKAGWLFIAVLFALLIGALNSGNNLLYLVLSLQFATVAASGIFSEMSVRPVRIHFDLPGTVTAGEPFLFATRLQNQSRFRSAYLMGGDPGGLLGKHRWKLLSDRWAFVLLPSTSGTNAGATLLQEGVLRRRGLVVIKEGYLATRAPFGLFDRRKRVPVGRHIAVLPAPESTPIPPLLGPEAPGETTISRAGEGYDLRRLRPYQYGESARRIAWRPSARAGQLLVREFEQEAFKRVRVVLVPPRISKPKALTAIREQLDRQAGVARFVAEELVRRGYRVQLVVPGAEPSEGFALSTDQLGPQLVPLAGWGTGADGDPLREGPGETELPDQVAAVRIHSGGSAEWPAGL